MTEVTESMIRRGMRELEDWACWNPQARPREDTTRRAVEDILTAALAHEPKEKQTMQKESEVNGVPLSIADGILRIGTTQHGWLFHRKTAPDLIAFIQQWLDHDPEEELIERIEEIRNDYTEMTYEESHRAIIATVREHDKKYGSSQ